jgi:hypothetical protein
LRRLNLSADTAITGAAEVEAQPAPTPEEIAAHFPQLEVIQFLGRGGMGAVYKARQKALGRLVALKLLAPERVADPKFAERFAHEAKALAGLNHPSIVTIHDFGLMEFVDGVNLRQAMKAALRRSDTHIVAALLMLIVLPNFGPTGQRQREGVDRHRLRAALSARVFGHRLVPHSARARFCGILLLRGAFRDPRLGSRAVRWQNLRTERDWDIELFRVAGNRVLARIADPPPPEVKRVEPTNNAHALGKKRNALRTELLPRRAGSFEKHLHYRLVDRRHAGKEQIDRLQRPGRVPSGASRRPGAQECAALVVALDHPGPSE